MLLLLIWRHVEYYTDPENAGRGETWKGALTASHTMSSALRFLAAPPEPQVFKEEVGKRLAPVLQRLSSHNVVSGQLLLTIIGDLLYIRITSHLGMTGKLTRRTSK